MLASIERLTGVQWKEQGATFLVALGHSATHWILGVFYVLVPFIAKDLGLSYTEAGALVTVVHVSAFAANVGSGAAVDVTGRRVVLQTGALVIGALALIGLDSGFGMVGLVVMVVIIGVTNNLWHPAAISFLSRRFPNNRGYALSVHALGANLGDTVAPLAAGGLLLWLAWGQVAMVSALPVFAVAVWIAVALMPGEKPGAPEASPSMSIGDYFTGLLGMVRDRAVLGICVMAGFRSMTQNGLFVFLPLYLVNVLETNPFLLGVAMMTLQLCGMIAAPIAGTVSDKIGRRSIVFTGLIVTTAGVAGLMLVPGLTAFIAVVGVIGFALFAVRPVVHSWLMDLTPSTHGGSATSLMFGVQSGLSALVPVVGGVIADQWGLPVVFYILAFSVFLSSLLVLPIPERKPHYGAD